MKVFLDLGAFDGDSVELARSRFGDIDKFYAFEPLCRSFERLERRFGEWDRAVLIRAAADTRDGEQELFLGDQFGDLGGSLCPEKINCKEESERVLTIDLARFIRETFSEEDEILLKIDIEGKEYDLLEHLIATGTIQRISRLYCEWHWNRVAVPRARHDRLLRRLNKLGFYLTGVNSYDEFMRTRRRRDLLTRTRFALGKRAAWLKLLLRSTIQHGTQQRTSG